MEVHLQLIKYPISDITENMSLLPTELKVSNTDIGNKPEKKCGLPWSSA